MTSQQPTSEHWEALYTAALLERDRVKFIPKAQAVEAAISERLRQIPSDIYESEQRETLLEALNNIQVLMSQEADPLQIPFVA
jgi:hypothetical protein